MSDFSVGLNLLDDFDMRNLQIETLGKQVFYGCESLGKTNGLMLPKSVNKGKIIRNFHEETNTKTYDFQFIKHDFDYF